MGVRPYSRRCAGHAPGEAEHAQVLSEAASLGLGEPVAISAEHGEGMAELYEALQGHVDAVTAATDGRPSEAQLACECSSCCGFQFFLNRDAIPELQRYCYETLARLAPPPPK